jgi:hypothetical protein
MWQQIAAASAMSLLDNKLKTSERAQAQRYATMMSNSAYQRAMKDMRKAGLNPILAGKYGGASTPSVGQAPVGVKTGEFMQQLASAKESGARTGLLGEQSALTNVQKDKVRFELDNILPFEQSKLIEEINKLGKEQQNILADTILKLTGSQEKIASAKKMKAETILKNIESEFKKIETLMLNLDYEGFKGLSEYFNIPIGKDFTATMTKVVATAFSSLPNLTGGIKMLQEIFGKKKAPSTIFQFGATGQ